MSLLRFRAVFFIVLSFQEFPKHSVIFVYVFIILYIVKSNDGHFFSNKKERVWRRKIKGRVSFASTYSKFKINLIIYGYNLFTCFLLFISIPSYVTRLLTFISDTKLSAWYNFGKLCRKCKRNNYSLKFISNSPLYITPLKR